MRIGRVLLATTLVGVAPLLVTLVTTVGLPLRRAAAEPGPPPSQQPAEGYWLAAGDGGIFSFGRSAVFQGSAGGTHLNAPIVGMAPTPDGFGYWLVASDGGVFTYGNAEFFGSAGGGPLASPVVGMAATPDGDGYWLLEADGTVLNYGDALVVPAPTTVVAATPAVAISADPDGRGYRILLRSGAVLSGGPANYGSAPLPGNDPAVGLASISGGYWVATASGKVYPFGGAVSYGQIAYRLNAPIVGVASASTGTGYYLLGRDGGVFTFGDANFDGSTADERLNAPVLGIAVPSQSPSAPVVHFNMGSDDEAPTVHIGTSVVVSLSSGGSWAPSMSPQGVVAPGGPAASASSPDVFTYATVGEGRVELNFYNSSKHEDVVFFLNVIP